MQVERDYVAQIHQLVEYITDREVALMHSLRTHPYSTDSVTFHTVKNFKEIFPRRNHWNKKFQSSEHKRKSGKEQDA